MENKNKLEVKQEVIKVILEILRNETDLNGMDIMKVLKLIKERFIILE